jgi:hypothetical protein
VTKACALCEKPTEVPPSIEQQPGEGAPEGVGVWVFWNKVCCSGCARRITAEFAKRCRMGLKQA